MAAVTARRSGSLSRSSKASVVDLNTGLNKVFDPFLLYANSCKSSVSALMSCLDDTQRQVTSQVYASQVSAQMVLTVSLSLHSVISSVDSLIHGLRNFLESAKYEEAQCIVEDICSIAMACQFKSDGATAIAAACQAYAQAAQNLSDCCSEMVSQLSSRLSVVQHVAKLYGNSFCRGSITPEKLLTEVGLKYKDAVSLSFVAQGHASSVQTNAMAAMSSADTARRDVSRIVELSNEARNMLNVARKVS